MFRVAGGEKVRITGAGRVGIGTVNPDSLLDVSGDSTFRGNVHATGIVTASSFVGALPISNDANNRLVTATGSGGLNAEGGLTYDGDQYFTFTGSGYKQLTASTTTNNSVAIKLQNQVKNFTITITEISI